MRRLEIGLRREHIGSTQQQLSGQPRHDRGFAQVVEVLRGDGETLGSVTHQQCERGACFDLLLFERRDRQLRVGDRSSLCRELGGGGGTGVVASFDHLQHCARGLEIRASDVQSLAQRQDLEVAVGDAGQRRQRQRVALGLARQRPTVEPTARSRGSCPRNRLHNWPTAAPTNPFRSTVCTVRSAGVMDRIAADIDLRKDRRACGACARVGLADAGAGSRKIEVVLL